MKTLSFLLFTTLFLSSIEAQTADELAIKKTILAETAAYTSRDFKAWADCWLDAPTTSVMMTPDDSPGGLFAGSGFKKMSDAMKGWMTASPKSEMQVTSQDGFIYRITSNMAWTMYDQKFVMTTTGAKMTSKELRVLEKMDGQWKISAQSSIGDFNHAEMPNPNPEEEAIKKLIVDETDFWLERNFDAWSQGFVHEKYLTWTVTNGGEPGDVLTMRSWDSLSNFMQSWFKGNTAKFAEEMKKSKVTRDKWNIQIRGNVAYVSFNQHSENEKQKMDITETRILEKSKGKWKIAMQATLADFKDATPPIRSKY